MKLKNQVQEAHPLKQGLKPYVPVGIAAAFWSSRGASTKTRIETITVAEISYGQIVQEAHPLKQGLKQHYVRPIKLMYVVQEAHPLKQGLKLIPSKDMSDLKKFKRRIH